MVLYEEFCRGTLPTSQIPYSQIVAYKVSCISLAPMRIQGYNWVRECILKREASSQFDPLVTDTDQTILKVQSHQNVFGKLPGLRTIVGLLCANISERLLAAFFGLYLNQAFDVSECQTRTMVIPSCSFLTMYC